MAYDFIEAAYSAPKDANPKASLEKSLAQFADAVTTVLKDAKDLADSDEAVKAAKASTDARIRFTPEEEPVKKTPTKKALKDMTHEELLAHAEEVEKNAPAPEPEPEPVPASVQKQLDAQAAEIKKANDRAEKAEADAKVEKEARERLRMAGFAKSKIPNLPGTDDEKGNVLYDAQNVMKKESYDELLKMLEAGDAAMAKTMDPVGEDEDGNAGDSAVGQLDAIAKQLVKDGKAKTYEIAFDKAAQENPDIYKQYRAERRTESRAH
jgi:DNA-binding PucR family transcriptional regulator